MKRLRDWLTCFVPAVPWLVTAVLIVAVLLILVSALRPKAHAQFGGVQQPMFATQTTETSFTTTNFLKQWAGRAHYISTEFTTNAGVYTLWDQYTNGWHLTGSGVVETYKTNLNGYTTLYMPGTTGTALTNTAFTITQPAEYVLLISTRNRAPGAVFIMDAATSSPRQQIVFSDSLFGASAGNLVTFGYFPTNVFGVYDVLFNGANGACLSNNVALSTSANFGANSISGITIPMRYSQTQGQGIDFVELWVFGTNLTADARGELFTYLTNKYQLTYTSWLP